MPTMLFRELIYCVKGSAKVKLAATNNFPESLLVAQQPHGNDKTSVNVLDQEIVV